MTPEIAVIDKLRGLGIRVERCPWFPFDSTIKDPETGEVISVTPIHSVMVRGVLHVSPVVWDALQRVPEAGEAAE